MIQQSNLVSPDGGEKREGDSNISTCPDKAMRKVSQQALDVLEEQGLIRKTGELVRGMAGDLQPVYTRTTVADWLDETGLIEDFNKHLHKLEVQEAFESLEREGLICKTGEFRHASNGELQPVYVATKFARKN